MKSFDFVYYSTRLGKPDVKVHRIISENLDKAFRALKFWKGANEKDVIYYCEIGEVTLSENFTVKV